MSKKFITLLTALVFLAENASYECLCPIGMAKRYALRPAATAIPAGKNTDGLSLLMVKAASPASDSSPEETYQPPKLRKRISFKNLRAAIRSFLDDINRDVALESVAKRKKEISFEKLRKKIRSILKKTEPQFNTETIVHIMAELIHNLPAHGYIDLDPIKKDIYIAVLDSEAAGYINTDGLSDAIEKLLIRLTQEEIIYIRPIYVGHLKNPNLNISMPSISVAAEDLEFTSSQPYQAMLRRCKDKKTKDAYDWNYISVNDILLKEPVGFPGYWKLTNKTRQDIQPWVRKRIMKSFALMLNEFAPIQKNRFKIAIIENSRPPMAASESLIAENPAFIMTEDEAGLIKFYVTSDYVKEPFPALRRIYYGHLSRIPDLKDILRAASSLPGKPPSSIPLPKLPKKKVVFLHLHHEDDDSGRPLVVPPSYYLMAAELKRHGFEVEFQPIKDGAWPIKGQRENTSSATIDWLTKRNDIGLFVILNACETDLYNFNRIAQALHKKSRVPIIAGGPFYTLAPEHASRHFPWITASLRGEGEEAILDLVKAFLGRDRDDIPPPETMQLLSGMDQLTFDAGNVSICNNIHKRRTVNDLDTLAIINSDFSFLTEDEVKRPLIISISRGCPRICIWCAHVHGYRHRKMSVDSIIQMLKNYKRRLDEINASLPPWNKLPEKSYSVDFADDDLLLTEKDRKDTIALLDRFDETGLKIGSIQISLGSLLGKDSDSEGRREPNYGLLGALARNSGKFLYGAARLLIGTDAFIDKEIERHRKGKVRPAGKGYDQREIEKVVEACEAMGIFNYHYLLMTDIETSWQDIFDHLYRIAEIGRGKRYFVVTDPNPFTISTYTTESYKQIAGAGRGLINWLLVLRKTANPIYEEFSYPLVFSDIPPQMGLPGLVYEYMSSVDKLYKEEIKILLENPNAGLDMYYIIQKVLARMIIEFEHPFSKFRAAKRSGKFKEAVRLARETVYRLQRLEELSDEEWDSSGHNESLKTTTIHDEKLNLLLRQAA